MTTEDVLDLEIHRVPSAQLPQSCHCHLHWVAKTAAWANDSLDNDPTTDGLCDFGKPNQIRTIRISGSSKSALPTN